MGKERTERKLVSIQEFISASQVRMARGKDGSPALEKDAYCSEEQPRFITKEQEVSAGSVYQREKGTGKMFNSHKPENVMVIVLSAAKETHPQCTPPRVFPEGKTKASLAIWGEPLLGVKVPGPPGEWAQQQLKG